MHELLHVVEIASVGIAVASTGAALAVIYAVFSPTCEREVGEQLRRRRI
jgi:hypothetical protein